MRMWLLALAALASGVAYLRLRTPPSAPPAAVSCVLSVFSGKGVTPGLLNTPRSVAQDGKGTCYVLDLTDRVQAFDIATGRLLRLWRLPDIALGRPQRILCSPDGSLYVTDTHYGRILRYAPEGTLLGSFGEEGTEPGRLHYPVGICLAGEDLWVSEYGGHDRLQRFSRDGRFLQAFGSHGAGPGQLMRPQGVALGPDGNLYVADAANHRIQVFSQGGALLRAFGEAGIARGKLYYPFDLAFDARGRLAVLECGSHRLSFWSAEGTWLGDLGGLGTEPGRLANPRGMCLMGDGTALVANSDNHRIERWRLP